VRLNDPWSAEAALLPHPAGGRRAGCGRIRARGENGYQREAFTIFLSLLRTPHLPLKTDRSDTLSHTTAELEGLVFDLTIDLQNILDALRLDEPLDQFIFGPITTGY